ncbi:MAG: dienelactone hydrolase family protein [Fimbriimonadaceae bacterium]|nr:dienelactone hydrolase family protein [Fimbriimonadaceae bacterium]
MTNALLLLLASVTTPADITGRWVDYQPRDDHKTTFHGYLVGDMDGGAKPGVIIVHQWEGLTDYEIGRAREIAELGYTVFCADVYGVGNNPKTAEERQALVSKYRDGDRANFRRNLSAAYSEIRRWPMVDRTKIAAIGYCFGGTGALEMARAGLDLKGVVSFHGGLSNPNPQDVKNIKCPVLVLHGADDPFVPPAEVDAFKKEMDADSKPYTFIAYPGAVHAFSQSNAGNDNSKGAAYNAAADMKSFSEMVKFFREIFR